MIIRAFVSWTAVAILIIALVLLWKFFTGKGKNSDQRSGLEKIACSLFSIFRTNIDDAANSLRTTKVLRDEAMQEIEDAIAKLKQSYKESKVAMSLQLKQMQEKELPMLNDEPGKITANAETWTKKYKKSVDEGHPIEAYKRAACTFFQQKQQAILNIEKMKKSIINLEAAIGTAEAEYAIDKSELEMMKNNILANPEIIRADVTTAISRIESLTTELTDKLDAQRIRAEVDREFRQSDEVTSASAENDFNNLFNNL